MAGLAAGLLLVSTAVALVGFEALCAATGSSEAGSPGRLHGRPSWTAYYRAVVLKGMLPQLVVALPLHPWLRRLRRRQASPALVDEAAHPGPWTRSVETFVLATLAYCLVAPTLLTMDWPGWPALHMLGAAQRIGTYLGMTTVVTLAIRLASRWIPAVRDTRHANGEPT